MFVCVICLCEFVCVWKVGCLRCLRVCAVCVGVCVCVCVCVWFLGRVCRRGGRVWVCMCVFVCMFVCVNLCVFVCVCEFVCVDLRACV